MPVTRRNKPALRLDLQPIPGGMEACSGSELAGVYQAGLEPQKIFCVGVIPGSPSSVPAGTTMTFPLFDNHGSDEPHFWQNAVAKYLVSGG